MKRPVLLDACILLCTLAAAPAAFGQHSLAMHNHSGTSSISACDPERYQADIPRFTEAEIGTLKHPVTSIFQAAKDFFNQGLTFYYGFDNESAMRSFYQAVRADKDLAMAYWGIALAAGGDLNIAIDKRCLDLAKEQIAIAKTKMAKASEQEREYIQALAIRYDTPMTPDPKLPNIRYAEAMEALNGYRGDQDPDAGALYAYSRMNIDPWNWWSKDPGNPDIGEPTDQIKKILPVLHDGLEAWPKHIGINHIKIHAWEEAPIKKFAGEAKTSADFFHKEDGAPLRTPHLRHMPAHTYLLLGDWENIVAANQRAVDADAWWVDRCPQQGSIDVPACNQLLVGHYYSHDLLFLGVGLGNRGDWNGVIGRATELEANVERFLETQPGLEHYLTTKVMMMVNFGKWQELAKLPKPTAGPPLETRAPAFCGQFPKNKSLATAIWYFGQAMAHASATPPQPTEADLGGFLQARDCVRTANIGWGNNYAADILKVVEERIKERIARSTRDFAKAKDHAQKAVDAEDALKYDEPPGWYVSSRVTQGATYFLSGDLPAALEAFKQDLRRRPNNSRSLFGLWKVLEAQGLTKEAEAAKAKFQQYWTVLPWPKMEDL